MTQQTITLPYRKAPTRFRNPADIEELVRHCNAHRHIIVRSNDGTRALDVKVNGQVKRWKRDPSRIAIPLKYGLRECATFDGSDINRVLIPVEG